MPSHLHLIVKGGKSNDLPSIIRDFKRFTNLKLIEAIKEYHKNRRKCLLESFKKAADKIKRNNNCKIWQDGFHSEELSDTEMIEQRLNYIHNNPVKEEVVINPGD